MKYCVKATTLLESNVSRMSLQYSVCECMYVVPLKLFVYLCYVMFYICDVAVDYRRCRQTLCHY